jgi:hypothetical protein
MIGVAMASYDVGFMVPGLLKVKIELKLQMLILTYFGLLLF